MHQLDREPDAQENPRREHNDLYEHEQGKQGNNQRPRVQQHIGPHHSGDCTAGADRRDQRVGVEPQMSNTRSNTGSQIENQIRQVSQSIFDVISKDVQKSHIAEEMHPATVQEDAGEQS